MDIMCQYYDYWIYVQLPTDSALCEDSTTNQTNDDYVNGRYSQSINQSHIESSLGPNLHGHTDRGVRVLHDSGAFSSTAVRTQSRYVPGGREHQSPAQYVSSKRAALPA